MNKKKIVFVCLYSYPSICGVWSRVYNLSRLLIEEGHDVHVISTNIIKSTKNTSCDFESYHEIKIHRIAPRFSFKENLKFWDIKKQIEDISPDLIIAEVYRHPHTALAQKIAKRLKIPCYLVTHAPFVEPHLRTGFENLLVNAYDRFYGRKILKGFDKIITITKWEMPFLEKIGIDRSKLFYLPNGIAEEFFIEKPKIGTGILFFGRIARIKDLETLIDAISLAKESKPDVLLRIIGPEEEDYKKELVKRIKENHLEENIKFYPQVSLLKDKINTIDSTEIFVLPSKREAMPISLIEAMSRGKIVIASNNLGSSEIIQDKKTGLLFPIGDAKKLRDLLLYCLDKNNEKELNDIKRQAYAASHIFRWNKIYNKFKELIN